MQTNFSSPLILICVASRAAVNIVNKIFRDVIHHLHIAAGVFSGILADGVRIIHSLLNIFLRKPEAAKRSGQCRRYAGKKAFGSHNPEYIHGADAG